MSQIALSASVLMNVSESRIEDIRWSGSDDERRLVNRLFETPGSYDMWESYHSGLMKGVGCGSNRKDQLIKMRKTRFALIHRQALFQYLRDSGLKGERREVVINAFHDSSDYMQAVVREHGRFLRSNSSLFCTDHLAYRLLRDNRFSNGIAHYRQRYMDYFSLYCNWIIAESEGSEFPMRRLLLESKRNLSQMQTRLLSMPFSSLEAQQQGASWRFWH